MMMTMKDNIMKQSRLAFLMMCSVFTLTGCITDSKEYGAPDTPKFWQGKTEKAEFYNQFKDDKSAKTLEAWWTLFNDPVMDKLVKSALAMSPDRAIALAKVEEARGVARTSSSSLFPQIGASGNASRADKGVSVKPGEYYDAAFDASFELDIFGKNRNAAAAADKNVEASQAAFENVTLTLIADVAKSYIEYRFYERQVKIAQRNLESERKTSSLIKQQNEFGEATRLDVERAENQVNNTKASIPDLKRQSDNARLRLSILTGMLPEYVTEILKEEKAIPKADVLPVLVSPAQVLNARPDIKAARAVFASQTKTTAAETAALFPSITLSGLFGIQDSAFASSANVWSVALGAAVSLIDFGKIEGRIDAAKAREEQAYQSLRKTVLEAVADVEQSIVAYAHINEQRVALGQSLQNARKAQELSQQLYKEGEVSFLDALDAQRSVNTAELSASEAEYRQSIALVSLYKSLGVY